jgi:hypothetical protein
METLLRSFTVKQLKDGHRLFGMDLPRKRTKRELAISIIERRWQWPSLSESLKRRRDQTEVVGQGIIFCPSGCAMLTFASLHSQYKGSIPLTWKRYSFLYNNVLVTANSIDRWFQFTFNVLKIQRANCFCVKPLVFDREWYSRVGGQSCTLREHI